MNAPSDRLNQVRATMERLARELDYPRTSFDREGNIVGPPKAVFNNVRLILEQSLLLTAASFGIGWALIAVTQDRFPRTLVLLAADTRTTFVVLFAGGIVASLAGIAHALRTPPSLALGG